MRAQLVGMLALMLLANCGGPGDGASRNIATNEDNPFGLAGAPPAAGERAGPQAPGTPAVAPRIAYRYTYRYQLAADRLAGVAAEHRALCDRLGPARCLLVNASLDGRDGAYSRGSLELRVAPAIAGAFGRDLTAIASRADGDLIGSGVVGEDLTRQVIDAQAGLDAKRTLRDRLQQLLATRQGKLSELLEVERALAITQQELDAATALLAELRQRLTMSRVDIAYESDLPPPGADARPVTNALGSVSDVFGQSLGALIQIAAALLPFAVVGGLVWLVVRATRRRRRTRADL